MSSHRAKERATTRILKRMIGDEHASAERERR